MPAHQICQATDQKTREITRLMDVNVSMPYARLLDDYLSAEERLNVLDLAEWAAEQRRDPINDMLELMRAVGLWLVRDMSDPRYSKDPAFRKLVSDKLAKSNF